MTKSDIKAETLQSWDAYKNRQPDEALAAIYGHASAAAKTICAWYWQSIKTKRRTSLAMRFATFVFLILGTVFPLLAAMRTDIGDRLIYTQLGVAALATAGLLQVADRVFGWSSGWLRYMTTVTTMENLTRRFELDWAGYMVGKGGTLVEADVKFLFELGKKIEEDLLKLQADETDKWVSEFNSGLALLDGLIKAQRESAEKAVDAARAEGKAKQPGAIEVTLKSKNGSKPVRIALDAEAPEQFLGPVWSRSNITPGLHMLQVTCGENPSQVIKKVVIVPSANVAHIDVQLPE